MILKKQNKTKNLINIIFYVIFVLSSFFLYQSKAFAEDSKDTQSLSFLDQVLEQGGELVDQAIEAGGELVDNVVETGTELVDKTVETTNELIDEYNAVPVDADGNVIYRSINDMNTCTKNGGVWHKEQGGIGICDKKGIDYGSNYTTTTKAFLCGYPENPTQFICEVEQICWFCGPLNKVIAVMQMVAQKVYKGVKSGMLGLLAACACIWIVIKIMKFIASVKYQDVSAVYTDIGKMLFRVLIASLVLAMGDSLWDYTVSPLASGAFDYGSAAITLDNQPTYCASLKGTSVNPTLDKSSVVDAVTPISVIGQKFVGNTGNAGGLLTLINQRLMSLIGISWVMISAAMNDGDACVPDEAISLFFTGIPLLIMGIIFLFAIPLKCADLVFRLGIFLVLLPLFIFAWAFPLTTDFAMKGLNMLIGIMLSFLLFAIMVGLCTEMIMTGLDLPPNLPPNVDELIQNLKLYYSLDTVDFVRTLALLVFSFIVINQVNDIVPWLADAGYESSSFEQRVKNVPSKVYDGTKNLVRAGMAIATAGSSEGAFQVADAKEAKNKKDKAKKEKDEKEGYEND